jgi:hypothetical protein
MTSTLELVTPPAEPMVDAETIGKHLQFSACHIRKLAAAGTIPGYSFGLGKKVHWRFKISEVDQAIKRGKEER